MFCGSPGLWEPTGDCDPGYYCPIGQNVSSPIDYICTPGHYCPPGSPEQVSCESGTFQDQFGRVGFCDRITVFDWVQVEQVAHCVLLYGFINEQIEKKNVKIATVC